ncbi:MAG TPA: hypothetical protein DCL07_00290, partial [Cryomorphaceae bacterium]|nr:hypothetical protein [Cryomorphaceae bacterium]
AKVKSPIVDFRSSVNGVQASLGRTEYWPILSPSKQLRMGSSLPSLDWIALAGTLGVIALYGMWRTRQRTTGAEFLTGKRESHWTTIGLGIIATQA